MTNSRNERRMNQKKKNRNKVILLSILVVVLLVGGYLAYVFLNVYRAASNSYTPLQRTGNHSALRSQDVTIGKNPISILLVGVESYSSGGVGGRTDTIIVVTLNPQTHKMTMVSIPRDSRVAVASEGNKMDKINAAYAFGAANGTGAIQGTINTVENYLNIPIDYYVQVGFNGFVQTIDELGGVDVNVPFDFTQEDILSHGNIITFKKGVHHLNGRKALAYVRMREQDPLGDFGRNQRQRQVIKAAIDKIASAQTLFKVDKLATIVGNTVKTNLKPTQIFALEKDYSGMNSSKINTLDLTKGSGQYFPVNGVNEWFLVPDPANVQKVSKELRTSLGLSPSNSSSGTTGSSNSSSGGTGSSSSSTGSGS